MTINSKQRPPAAASRRAGQGREQGPLDRLRSSLTGAKDAGGELPDLPQLLAAVIALASGKRRKVLLPLGATPTEFALVRRGERVTVDYYGTEAVPQILLRNREIELATLLEICASAARAVAEQEPDPAAARTLSRLAARSEQTRLRADPYQGLSPVHVTAGAIDDPGESVPLAFGFDVSILPSIDAPRDAHFFADVHALLFEGEIWAYCRGKRLLLQRGSVMLATQRMVTAARALIEAWEANRPLNIRLRSESLLIGARLEANGSVAVTLSGENERALTIAALDVPGAVLPILRLASDLLRAFISADRVQSRNLRVSSLRKEVRALGRMIRARGQQDGFENTDPELLRLACTESADDGDRQAALGRATPGKLRFSERWRVELDGLDAASTFLCGNRLIAATAKMTLALDRDSGSVLWNRPSARAACFVAGTSLLRLYGSGELELCDLETGDVLARTRITPRSSGQHFALFAGGGSLPPLAVLPEGRRRLAAIDLRTGEPRWRFHSRGPGPFQVTRWGKVLLVTCGDGAVQAIEIASGETIWRFADSTRFRFAPVICGDRVIAAGADPAASGGLLYGIDLYSGRLQWKSALGAALSCSPIGTGLTVVAPAGSARRRTLIGLNAADGRRCWKTEDPGIASGGASICIDGLMIVNAPSGQLGALELQTGRARWARSLSDALTDDVPRQLEPVLRLGALFVPAARVHVVRPADGEIIAVPSQCDLVPDYLRVDERGWLYVAEESGHLRAYAPAPYLVSR